MCERCRSEGDRLSHAAQHLTLRDQRALLSCLREVHTLHDVAGAPFAILAATARVVPTSTAFYHEFDLATPAERITVQWPADVVPPSDFARVEAHVQREHPMPAHFARRPQSGSQKISDFLTRRQYQRTALYAECYRPFGVEHQIAVPLTIDHLIFRGLVLNRDRSDFTERERRLLDLLRPHLTLAFHNAAAFSGIRARLRDARGALEASADGVIVLDGGGRVRLETARARRLEHAYFGTPRGPSRLPEALRAWVRSCLAGLGPDDVPAKWAPLEVARDDRRLVVRLVPDLSGGGVVLLLGEEPSPIAREALDRLGLSPREFEVLGWVARGKSNGDVATILGTSPRTVQKHLEHIFKKLGVETRTAAAACLWETREMQRRT
jgi:DNA-binding CsgD family transcriptional regulator/PAS domain-containing protein